MWYLLAGIGIPIVFTILVWVVVTAWRVLHPEEAFPIDEDPEITRRRRLRSERPVGVVFEDIRLRERERVRTVPGDDDYVYEDGFSSGLPAGWTHNLDERKN